MEVVAMRGVVVRTEHAVEDAARAVANLPQESPIGVAAAPLALDAYAPAAFEHEARDVDGIGGRVPAERRAFTPVDATARIAAEVLEARDILPEMSARGRLQDVRLPQRERDRAPARE